MRTIALLSALLVVAGLLAAAPATAFTYWNDLRASALLPDDAVTLRVENPSAAGVENTVHWLADGLQQTPLLAVDDGPSTVEATVPGPVSSDRSYGFRLVQGDDVDLLAPRLPTGATPDLADLLRLQTDPAGDAGFDRVNLDLVDCRLGRDGARLWAALTNAGGGFPTADGFTFFSYLLGINNPAVADPETVFAMIHTVDVSGVIEPGLYQINGTGIDDLVKIGEIEVTELAGASTLLLSCELADLEANPVFQAWYDDADPRLGVAAFSQQITVFGGAQEADRTPGGVWHLREVALEAGGNLPPQLADLVIPEAGGGAAVTVTYADPDGNCPVLDDLVIDGATYPLRPQSLDYAGPVSYASAPALPPVEDGTWTEIVARFSDDAVVVQEITEAAVGVADARGIGLQLRAAPNPFTARTEFAFRLPRDQAVELAVHDLAGRRVATLAQGRLPAGAHTRGWDGRDDAGRQQPSGVYVYRLQTADTVVVRRLTLLR
jgi:hypothetical protein